MSTGEDRNQSPSRLLRHLSEPDAYGVESPLGCGRIALYRRGAGGATLGAGYVEAAEAEGTEVDIIAYPVGEFDQHIGGIDCALLGPQVGYMKAQMQAKAKAAGVPCDVIPMADYGMVNGKNVLAFAKKLIG